MREFLNQLRRRKVFTVAVAYVVTAWLLLQVAATLFPIFEAPDWVLKVFTVALFLGFPASLVLAWAYDLTPGGIVRADDLDQGAAEASARSAEPATGSITLPSGPSIAVLPFRNLSGDPSQDLFAEALTGDIATGLTRSSHLFILSPGAAAGLDRAEQDLAGTGRSLGVNYLLSGTVQKAGGTLRVSGQLTDVANAVRIWSQKYDRELNAENLFAVQDDIREQIVATLSDLHGVIYSEQLKRNVHRPTDSLNAYECLSVALAYDKYLTPQHHLLARESLERAIELDPSFDEAWSHLSWVYTDEEVFGFNPQPNAMERALRAARKAVELAPDNYHNHWLLSRVHYFMGQRELFLAESRRALDLNSSDGTTLGLIGLYTAWAGEWERGMDMVDKARLLNPNHPDYYHSAYGVAAYARGEFAEALEALHRASLPEWLPHQAFLVASYVKLGRMAEAERTLAAFLQHQPDFGADAARAVLEKTLPFQRSLVRGVLEDLERAGLPTSSQAG